MNKDKISVDISELFPNYKVCIVLNIDLMEFLDKENLTDKFETLLETEDRVEWLKIKTQSQDPSIYVLLIRDEEIVACHTYSKYITIFTDVYSKMYNMLDIKREDCIIGNTLMVNPKYRNLGIGTKLKQYSIDKWVNIEKRHLLGSTVSLDALNLYIKLGANVLYEEYCEEEQELYYYYYWLNK